MDNAPFSIRPYGSDMQPLWDDTVRASRNGTFLFERRYMDYHADRFIDRSLVIYDAKGHVAALFAAADAPGADGTAIVSHPGLTYGGLILPFDTGGADVCGIMRAVCAYWRADGRKTMVYRPVPHIYHRFPCEEDIYALFRCGATVDVCQLSAAYENVMPPRRNENTRRNISRGLRNGIYCSASDDYATFHAMLSANLAERHGTAPVHTLAELRLLAERFPDNIRLWMASGTDGTAQAAVLMYITDTCAHCQYIASTTQGRRQRALAVLISHLMDMYGNRRYFDFGTCNEDAGRYLNEGLLRQKNGFGARGIAYVSYSVPL